MPPTPLTISVHTVSPAMSLWHLCAVMGIPAGVVATATDKVDGSPINKYGTFAMPKNWNSIAGNAGGAAATRSRVTSGLMVRMPSSTRVIVPSGDVSSTSYTYRPCRAFVVTVDGIDRVRTPASIVALIG